MLQVNPQASRELIKCAYRTLMLKQKQHPDLGGNTAKAASINEAYSTLSDPGKRLEYDRLHERGKSGSEQLTGLYGFLKVAPNACPAIIARACQLLREEMVSKYPAAEALKKLKLLNQARQVLMSNELRLKYDRQLENERRRRTASCTVTCAECGELNYILPEEQLSSNRCVQCASPVGAVLIQSEVPLPEEPAAGQPGPPPQSWMGKADHVEYLCRRDETLRLEAFLPYLEDPDGRVRDATVACLNRRLVRAAGAFDVDDFLKTFSLSSTAGRPSLLRLIPAVFKTDPGSDEQAGLTAPLQDLVSRSLESGDEAIRGAARETFEELFPKKGMILREALRQEGKTVGDIAVMALSFSSDRIRPLVAAYLTGFTLEPALSSRVKGCRLMGRVGGPEAEHRLIHLLRDDEWVIQEEAARSLALCGTNRAVQHLVDSLKSTNQVLREEAVKTLGRIGSPDVVPIIRQALSDEDWRVRMAAETVLEMFSREGDVA